MKPPRWWETARPRSPAPRHWNPAGPAVPIGDPTRLRQALLNYASNAIKFTERGTVTCACPSPTKAPTMRCCALAVEDTGPGITPAVLASLFSTFAQGDNSTTRASTAAPASVCHRAPPGPA